MNGIDRPLSVCIGLDTINDRIIIKVITEPTLPKTDKFGDNGRKAIKVPRVISIIPVIFENILVLKNVNVHEKKGLFSAKGLMVSASCLVNFSSPILIKIKTRPYLTTEVKVKIESIAVAVFITHTFETNFRI